MSYFVVKDVEVYQKYFLWNPTETKIKIHPTIVRRTISESDLESKLNEVAQNQDGKGETILRLKEEIVVMLNTLVDYEIIFKKEGLEE